MSDSPQNLIRKTLNKFRTSLALEHLKIGMLLAVTSAVLVLGITITAESLWYLVPATRTTFLLIGGGIVIFLLFSTGLWLGLVTSGSLPRYTDRALAKSLGKAFPAIGDHLINALALLREHRKYGYSENLTQANLQQVAERVRPLNPKEAVSARTRKALLRVLGVMTLFWIVAWLPFAKSTLQGGYRVLHPAQEFAVPRPFEFAVTPGNLQVLDSDSLTLAAEVQGERPEQVHLTIKQGTEAYTQTITPNAAGIYSHTLNGVHRDFQYYFHAKSPHWWDRWGELRSDAYRVQVISRPQIQSLAIHLIPPSYSGLPARDQEVTSTEIAALKGTKVQVFARANKPVRSAGVVFQGTADTLGMDVSSTELRTELILTNQAEFALRLEDHQGISNVNPAVYQLVPLPDESPRVEIVQPPGDVDLGDNLQIPLVLNLQDDYGFSGLAIQYRVQKPAALDQDSTWKSHTLSLEANDTQALEYSYLWDLNTLDLSPRDQVRYRAALWDNDTVSGPKVSYSNTFLARFPSLGDMFARVRQQQSASMTEAEDIAQQVERIKKQVDQLTLEMQKKEEVTWQQQQQAENIISSHEELKEQLEKISQELGQMLEMAERHQLFSDQVMQKYRQLQQLFQEVMTPELEEALQELQQSLDNTDPKEVRQAMENLQISEQELSESLDRAMELFKRVRIEQQTDEIVKRIHDLVEQQTDINRQADSSAANPNALGQEEQLAADEYEITEQKMESLSQLMEEFPNLPADSLRNALEQARSDSILPNMRQAQRHFQQGELQQGRPPARRSQQGLQQLANQLQRTQDLQRQQMMAEVMDEFRSVLQDVLSLSQQQEEIFNQTQPLQNKSPRLNELADQQQNLQVNLQHVVANLVKLSQKTFGVTRDIGKALGETASNMQQSLHHLSQHQANNAANTQSRAMTALNETAQQLIASMNSLQSQQSSTGFENFLQQMEQLTKQQRGVNQGSSRLGMSGQPSMAQRAAMQQLASRQMSIRGSLGELQQALQNSGGRSGLGDLGKIGEDMEEVAKDLRQGDYQRRTQQRQQQILSRMLDAQKSINTRDYSRERQSTGGEDVVRAGPAGLPADYGERRNVLQEDLDQALREGYSRSYEQLIREYFEQLSQRNQPSENSEQ